MALQPSLRVNHPETGPTRMHPNWEQLDAFARGEISEADAAAIEDHLASCADCAERLGKELSRDHFVELVREAGHHAVAKSPPPVVPMARPFPTGYELIEPIGRGGMGVVFRARQRSLGRIVALKQIRAGLDAEPKELARFQAEAEAAARLQHPNIVQVYDVGLHEGLPYLAMELLESGTLAHRLARGPLGARPAAALIEQVARAIQHAHDVGIIHRDVTPSNILFAADGAPKVADFGLAKRLDAGPAQTETGAVLGTPRYMAPERTEGKPATAAVDIYALGAILYECLTGRAPFQGATPLETLDQVRTMEPAPLSRLQPGVPVDLQTICLKCLEKVPERRYSSAAELAEDLARYQRGEPIHARRSSWPRRLAKWARRRPYQAAIMVVLGASVTGGFAGLLAHQRRLRIEVNRAERAAAEAHRQKAVADANYREASAALKKILEWTADPRFARVPQRSELHRAQAETALAFYEAVLKVGDSPDSVVRLDTAQAAHDAGNLCAALGRQDEAATYFQRALRLLGPLRNASPNDSDVMSLELSCWVKLGVVYSDDPAESITALNHAIKLSEHHAELFPASTRNRRSLAWCAHNLGWALQVAGRREEAGAQYERAIELYREFRRDEPGHPELAAALAGSLAGLGQIKLLMGDPAGAGPPFKEANDLLEANLATKSNWIEDHYVLAEMLIGWGNLASSLQDFPSAERRYRRGIELIEPLLEVEPTRKDYRRTGMALYGSLANVLGPVLGRYEEASQADARASALCDDPELRLKLRFLQAYRLVRGKSYADGVAIVRELTSAGSPGGANLYNSACAAALAATAARADSTLEEDRREVLATSYRETALELLRRADEVGFFDDPANASHVHEDPDLDSLRDQAEFQALFPTPAP